MNLLEVSDVDTAYGAIAVNRNVSLVVAEREIVTVLGPNGADKTTLLRAICGLLMARRGRILFRGNDISRLPPDQRAKIGVVMVPEGRKIFADLTVRENLRLGAYARADQKGVEARLDGASAHSSPRRTISRSLAADGQGGAVGDHRRAQEF